VITIQAIFLIFEVAALCWLWTPAASRFFARERR
jgi:hypothetical protein